jgi:branched-chain amino acid transport system substrate-binding protein
MKSNITKSYKRLKRYFGKFDRFQLLAIPVLLILVYFSIDFKSNDINIGIILPLTGNFAYRTQSHLNGIKLAVKNINESGGINNSRLRIIVKDSNLIDPAEATRDLIYKEKVSMIIGGFSSEETRTIQYLSEKALIPFLTAICTHFEIAKSASYTFRSITDDQQQFEALSSLSSNKYQAKRPAIIYDTNLYGAESAQRYIEICSKHSQQVTNALSFPKGTINFREQLEALFKTNPDSLVILAPAADSALIVRQAREMKFNKPILGANQCASSEFLRLAGIYSESIITTLPYNPRAGGQKLDTFLNAYQEKYGLKADSDAETGYEALMIVTLALKTMSEKNLSLRESLASLKVWDSIIGSGGFDEDGNQVRPAEIAIIKERQTIPISMEELF